MEELLKVVALGIIQGLTEFLPVSSSGHLVLLEGIMGVKPSGALLEVLLHIGTLIAVFIVFWRQILAVLADTISFLQDFARSRHFKASIDTHADAWTGLMIIVGTFGTALVALPFKTEFEAMFGVPSRAAVMLLVTGGILWLSRWASRKEGKPTISLRDALLIGIFQGAAITPGISRSGTTIVVALLLGVEREKAATFSFLLSVPAILLAAADKVREMIMSGSSSPMSVSSEIAGVIVSAVVGYFSLVALMRFVRRGKLHYFSPYCWAVGLLALLWFHVH